MSTPPSPAPDSTPTPAPKPPSPAAAGDAAKPAFKVTRSPFAPKISGSTGASSAPATMGPMSISTSSVLSDKPVPRASASSSRQAAKESEGTGLGGLLLDAIAAGVAVTAAVLMGLEYLKATGKL